MTTENAGTAASQIVLQKSDRFLEYFGMWLMGGGLYCLLEVAWRGWTHWTMFLAGGTLFLIIGVERGKNRFRWSLVSQALIAGFTITAGEFLAGCVVNLCLHMRVWDYADKPYNLFGQISLVMSLAWCAVGLLAVLLFDALAWLLFNDEKPHYKIL